MNARILATLALLAAGAIGGCAEPTSPGNATTPAAATSADADGTRVTDAVRGVMQDRSHRSAGEALFVEKCSMCHRQMGMGTVILARRLDPAKSMLEKHDTMTVEFIVAAARGGIGNMPRIQKGEVSDAQLRQIARYLIGDTP